jgi:hypothetical protein
MEFPPDQRPNLSPQDMFSMGIFGGSYWRPISSGVLHKDLQGQHEEFRTLGWWNNIKENMLSSPKPDPKLNYYGVSAGSSLQEWESKGWIIEQDPYGWVQWYCRYYAGRRSPDDARQIQRWLSYAGPKGRWRRQLINKLARGETSPVIQQGLLQWGYLHEE